jgi:hypothetical protein
LVWVGWFIEFSATFNNISVILWLSVLLVEETGVPVELYNIILYRAHLACAGFEPTTLVVIGTDCIGGLTSNYHTIFCRLSITTESFISSTVKLWNRLDQSDRNLDKLSKFKKAIRKEQSDNTKRIPKHLYYGPRKLNIILTQLRNSYSFLNYDLSKVNIVNDAACSCGASQEDAFHYFFTCPNYAEIRLIMMNN